MEEMFLMRQFGDDRTRDTGLRESPVAIFIVPVYYHSIGKNFARGEGDRTYGI